MIYSLETLLLFDASELPVPSTFRRSCPFLSLGLRKWYRHRLVLNIGSLGKTLAYAGAPIVIETQGARMWPLDLETLARYRPVHVVLARALHVRYIFL